MGAAGGDAGVLAAVIFEFSDMRGVGMRGALENDAEFELIGDTSRFVGFLVLVGTG